ncbi:ankyrin repeat domain-containing protein, partial [Candidatus Cardinium hertigii]|uniref:ankyrin repeat domain-containing protein n=1 Tax=Candidatus Cardinium hertigii TaxID=247481 RepID=UPI003D7F0291
HLATSKNHVEVLKLLLEDKGILVNEKTNYGNTALDLARKENCEEIFELLLNAGSVSGHKV